MKVLLLLSAWALTISLANTGWCQTTPGTTISFTNGVSITASAAFEDAVFDRDELAQAVRSFVSGTGIQSEPLTFLLSFNQSGGLLLDLFEASQQLVTDSVSQFLRYVSNFDLAPDSFQELALSIAQTIDSGTFVIDSDLQSHVRAYRAEIKKGNKVLIVSHSQGNFYANKAYRVVFDGLDGQPPLSTNSLGIVSVATPASFVAGNGTYTTVLLDPVILAVIAATTKLNLPQPLIPNTLGLGHTFVSRYLEGEFSRPKILNNIVKMTLALTRPPVGGHLLHTPSSLII